MCTSTDIQTGAEDIVSHDKFLRSRITKSKSQTIDRDLDKNTQESKDSKQEKYCIKSLPSARIPSTERQQIDVKKQRIFPSIQYASRVSYFDPRSKHRDFEGFYILFWVALTIMVITTCTKNLKDIGYPIRVEIWRLFRVKVWELALVDGLMILTTTLSLPLHQFFRSKLGVSMRAYWKFNGKIIQSLYQFLWFTSWTAIACIFDWTWTAQVFLLLHTFVLLMKMHSYAFYNGHLSEMERRLKALDNSNMISNNSAYQDQNDKDLLRPKMPDLKLMDKIKVTQLREDLTRELTSLGGSIKYPNNLTWSNYIDYLLCPTLCYELEYPRTNGIVWPQLCYKILAVFGGIFLLTITSEEFIVPVLAQSKIQLENVTSISERILILAETIPMLLFPFMITFLLIFLVLFEYVLGAFAEITCFADRQFYSDWWNSTDWMQFSRKWNVPVYHFFRRHVYIVSSPHIGRRMATFSTFLLSSLGHELLIACITKKVRGYGFVLQMSQLPLVVLQRTKWVKDKKVLNNFCFWLSIILGTSMICSLYVLF